MRGHKRVFCRPACQLHGVFYEAKLREYIQVVGRKEGFTWMRDGDANPNEIDAASDLSAGFHAAAVLAHCRQMFGLE